MDFSAVEAAADRLAGHFSPSPLVHSAGLSRTSGAQVWLKLENLMPTGSFKIRGALNRLLTLDRSELQSRGVVAASAGNHGQGVALAASRLGVGSTIVMPHGAPIAKQQAVGDYGAEVVLAPGGMAGALDEARRLAAQGKIMIHPFDDEQVIAGQGTVGLEIGRDLPAVDLVASPVGGGGLISGVAVAVKHLCPGSRVIGVQAEAAPAAVRAFEADRVVEVPPGSTVADGVAVPRVGRRCLAIMSRLVDRLTTVDERQIYLAMLELIEKKRVVAEGAGALTLAALHGGQLGDIQGRRVVLIVSGGNVDVNVLGRILHQGLVRTGRILRLAVDLPDRPGALAGLTAVLAAQEANVLDIDHDRLGRDAAVDVSRVVLDVEVRGEEHGRAVLAAVNDAGYTSIKKGG
ncbi:MAG: threonine ammonia-lyase [Proteobacteria bacterium]|nr:threonine ammonia-lyase [Pseudomonadota bacterium]MBU1740053.1 threonine ammonia-lyase [Pseudomonadota bacterium]